MLEVHFQESLFYRFFFSVGVIHRYGVSPYIHWSTEGCGLVINKVG